MFKQGEQYKHGLAIDVKYGAGTAMYLQELTKEKKQFKVYELEEMIDEYFVHITLKYFTKMVNHHTCTKNISQAVVGHKGLYGTVCYSVRLR